MDFVNAFSCLHRDHMLNIVKEVVLEIYCFCYSVVWHLVLICSGQTSTRRPTGWSFILFGDREAPQVDPFNILLRLYGRHQARGEM